MGILVFPRRAWKTGYGSFGPAGSQGGAGWRAPLRRQGCLPKHVYTVPAAPSPRAVPRSASTGLTLAAARHNQHDRGPAPERRPPVLPVARPGPGAASQHAPSRAQVVAVGSTRTAEGHGAGGEMAAAARRPEAVRRVRLGAGGRGFLSLGGRPAWAPTDPHSRQPQPHPASFFAAAGSRELTALS